MHGDVSGIGSVCSGLFWGTVLFIAYFVNFIRSLFEKKKK